MGSYILRIWQLSLEMQRLQAIGKTQRRVTVESRIAAAIAIQEKLKLPHNLVDMPTALVSIQVAKIVPSAAQLVQRRIPKTASGKGVPHHATGTVIPARSPWNQTSGAMAIIATVVCHRHLPLNHDLC